MNIRGLDLIDQSAVIKTEPHALTIV